MSTFWTYLKANWKTNLAAFCAFAYSVPQFVAAITAWQAGQKPDWHGAVISLVIALGLAAAKDGTNHSTQAQVNTSTQAVAATNQIAAIKATQAAQVAAVEKAKP